MAHIIHNSIGTLSGKAGNLVFKKGKYGNYVSSAPTPTQNDSTKMLDDDKMKELIHTIVDVVRKNATIDWSKRDDVRAKLRLTVKKILMRYGYPSDLAKLEADRVLAQSENLAEFFAGKKNEYDLE